LVRSIFLIAVAAAACVTAAVFAVPVAYEAAAAIYSALGPPAFSFVISLIAFPAIGWAIVALTREEQSADHHVAGFATFLRPQTGLPEPTSVA
jgi:hypothetical protein